MCHHRGFSTPDISDHVAMLDAQAWQPSFKMKKAHFVMYSKLISASVGSELELPRRGRVGFQSSPK